jgi:triacylglycerol lipase
MTPRPTVVLLHGLARTWRSMSGLRRHLEREGFATWAETYPSRRMPIAELAAATAEHIRAAAGPGAELMAVTHSLGGILVRHMPDLPWRRVVMLAPPNQGSLVARSFRELPAFRWFYGPAGQEVALGDEWPAPPAPFGVIAGTRTTSVANPTSWLTTGLRVFPPGHEHDGTVSVEETRLPGMADFRTVAAGHTFIMNDPRVRAWVVRFLREGRFG